MEAIMADEFTVTMFKGPGPFVLPPAAGPIKFSKTETPDGYLLEWPLPQDPGQTRKIVQLPVRAEIAMALMIVLKKAQKELDLPIPKGQTSDRRFQ